MHHRILIYLTLKHTRYFPRAKPVNHCTSHARGAGGTAGHVTSAIPPYCQSTVLGIPIDHARPTLILVYRLEHSPSVLIFSGFLIDWGLRSPLYPAAAASAIGSASKALEKSGVLGQGIRVEWVWDDSGCDPVRVSNLEWSLETRQLGATYILCGTEYVLSGGGRGKGGVVLVNL